jgi:phenylalanyl-tRNA synthetase beta chain
MLILGSWLREFVPFTVSAEKLAEDLTLAGLEVEGLESAYRGLDQVVAAYVKRAVPHPEKSSLQICTVSTGDEEIQVLCGAPNVREHQWVALAKPGAVLAGGVKVRSSTIWDVRSDGMLCSEAELGIGDDEAGILVLDPDAGLVAGRSLMEVMGLADWVFDISVTPNRPDCLSVLGIAREVAALYGLPLRDPCPDGPSSPAMPQAPMLDVPIAIENPELCGRYCAAVLEGIRIAPSPYWLVRRLEAGGIRPVNNVVDITNYVLLERGQPLHAFDLDRLNGPAIFVRTSSAGERILTLDGRESELAPGMLVIADAQRPVAVAGVMGGANSEVTNGTRQILFESAWFAPAQVRRTAKALKLTTESSFRFERGVDPEGVISSLRRAVGLTVALAGGRLAAELKDLYPRPHRRPTVRLRPERTNRLLGTSLSVEEMAGILKGIGMDLSPYEGNSIEGRVPSYRPDLVEEVDLVEEIARLHGFANIPTSMPRAAFSTLPAHSSTKPELEIRNALASQGMTEVVSYSFLSPREIRALGLAEGDPRNAMVRIQNPLSDEQSVMRTSLVPSLLGAAARNQAQRNLDMRLFEIGMVFLAKGPGELPREEQRVAALIIGSRHPLSWSWPVAPADLFDLKGVLEGLLAALRVRDWKAVLATPGDPFYLPGASARVTVGNSVLGTFGEIAPSVLECWGVHGPAFVFDLSAHALLRTLTEHPRFSSLPRYPAVERDVALIVSDTLSVQELLGFIDSRQVPLIENVDVFDVYRGRPIAQGAKSVGLRLRYRALDHTLSDGEVSAVHDPLVLELLKAFDAELRS